MKNRIEKKLKESLKIEGLEVINNSSQHKGHIENDESGETHFAVIIKSEELKKLAPVQAHRRVNLLLKEEFTKGLHALEIKIL